MANVAIHREGTPQASSATGQLVRDWEPFRLMREMFRWDPFGEMGPSFRSLEMEAFAPSFDVKETKESFVFSADLPGVKDSDLDVRLSQNRLTIAGKRESEKSEKGDQFYTTERSYGSFTRAFTLPDGVQSDKVMAELKSGVLTVSIPKKPEAQPKKIDVATK